MSDFYVLDKDKKPSKVSINECIRWRRANNEGDESCEILKQETIGKYFVSTIFLFIDHSFFGINPILFETRIFRNKDDGERAGYQEIGYSNMYEDSRERYHTWDEAMAGHKEACEMVKNDSQSVIDELGVK